MFKDSDIHHSELKTPLGTLRPGVSASDADTLDPWDKPLSGADQACKECRRRKARCDRTVPTCSICIKYGRHCLYEKHSKTPLTRKHLTEVEERLERAERLLRQARLQGIAQHKRGTPRAGVVQHPYAAPLGVEATSQSSVINFGAYEPRGPPYGGTQQFCQQPGNLQSSDYLGIVDQGSTYLPLAAGQSIFEPASAIPDTDADDSNNSTHPLEAPPLVADDFEWDEQHVPAEEFAYLDDTRMPSNASGAQDSETTVIDGMASLTLDESEGGYLGITSGAALLRIIDPFASKNTTRHKASRIRLGRVSSDGNVRPLLIYEQPNPNRHILDSMLDSYFDTYHISYPFVHEPTFRAQYFGIIERPNGDCWLALAYVIAAMGIFSSSTTTPSKDLAFFAQAKSLISINHLECGNLTLVQTLTLMANYLQKRNKPNSGYNYLGLAMRMAMGLGLHKEFQGWGISPLKMEIRRRVWWTLCSLDFGGTITFSRPLTWPGNGVEVTLPMNIHDRDLTAASQTYPEEANELTTYSTVRIQATFYLATKDIYTRVISKPFPSPKELIRLDDQLIGGWYASLPSYFQEYASIPPKFDLAHLVMMLRYRNLRLIMYRPFVIRQALNAREGKLNKLTEEALAYDRCLLEAKCSIATIREFWSRTEHNKMNAWYTLYFIFQAVLIPCICLRNEPISPSAHDWREQIRTTLRILEDLGSINSSGPRCGEVILGLCGQYLEEHADLPHGAVDVGPTDDSPQMQMNNVYSMMWPNVPALESDVAMGDDAWMEFLRGEYTDFGSDGV